MIFFLPSVASLKASEARLLASRFVQTCRKYLLLVAWISTLTGFCLYWSAALADMIPLPFFSHLYGSGSFFLAYNTAALSGIVSTSFWLGYNAIRFFELFCISLFCLNFLRMKAFSLKETAKSLIRSIGVIGTVIAIFEFGIFVSQPWSCTDRHLYPQFAINLFQWAQMGFANPPASLGCEWTMNFYVSQYAWEYLHITWLHNWSFALVGLALSSVYFFLRIRRFI